MAASADADAPRIGPSGGGARAPRRHPSSPARVAASRANGLKSPGPRTSEGKQRSSQNARKGYSARLRGEIEARTLGQEAGAAEDLYRELVAPYERPGRPVPAMLAMHFHDLARLRLELDAWERIRDAQMEEKWRQGQLELRRRLYKLQVDLPATTADVFEQGLCRLGDSPARAKQQAQCLRILEDHLERRDYDILPMLEKLYGKGLKPVSDRAATICMRCERLLHPEKYEALSEEQLHGLLALVALEEDDAVRAYELHLDDASLPRPARLARLGPGERDRAMNLQGERLRQDIDRKQRLILAVVRMLGLNRPDDEDQSDQTTRPTRRDYDRAAKPLHRSIAGKKDSPKFQQNEPTRSFRINKKGPKRGQNEPKRT